mgnify:FL=1|jgi:hypothetical protein
MKGVGKFIGGLFLFLIAWALFLPLSLLNFLAVAIKFKDLGYFKSSAVNLDRFGNFEFRTLFNLVLKKKGGYEFGNFEETISSALGKNQRNGTLTRTGKVLAWILDTIEKEHCKKSIKEFK